MPGLPEDTASLAQEYTTVCKYYGRFNDYSDVELGCGGVPKGSRGNTSSGIRGGEDVK